MTFDRRNLPDPVAFYESHGLKLTGRGKWRTTSCTFHGGSDSMRVNTETGAFACMAGCGARGGRGSGHGLGSFGRDKGHRQRLNARRVGGMFQTRPKPCGHPCG